MKLPNKDHKHLEIIGAVHIDDIATPGESLVSRASNPVTWEQRLGGVASNAACAAARYNSKQRALSIALFAAVGDDPASHSLYQTLIQLGVTPKFQNRKNSATGRYCAVMTHDGELYIGLADVSLAESLSAQNVIKQLNESALTQPPKSTSEALNTYGNESMSSSALLLDANLSMQCLSDISRWAANHSVPCGAMSVSPAKARRLSPIAKHIDILFCNRREAVAIIPEIADDAPLWRMADALMLHGFKQFVLTDGIEPLIVQSLSERTTLEVPQASATRSVNGAGDALAGSSMAAWMNGYSLMEAVRDIGLVEAQAVVEGAIESPLMSNSQT